MSIRKMLLLIGVLLAVGGASWFGYATARPVSLPAEAANLAMEELLDQTESPQTATKPEEAIPLAVAASSSAAETPEANIKAPAHNAAHSAAKAIDLNTATLEQLMELPGIGESKAKAIIELRTRIGSFRSVDQLKEVKGIGDKVWEKLQPYVKTGGS